MKVKSFNKTDYRGTWVATVTSIIALLFTVAVGFGWITGEQSAQAQPLVSSLIGAVATIITGVGALIGIFTKPTP